MPTNTDKKTRESVKIPNAAHDNYTAQVYGIDDPIQCNGSGKGLPFDQHPDNIKRQDKHIPIYDVAE